MIEKSIALAKNLQTDINTGVDKTEQSFRDKMKKLLANPSNKVMLIELLDRSFRSKDAATSHELISSILSKYGMADFFTSGEKFLLFLFLGVGKSLPSMSVNLFVSKLKSDTKAMVLDDTPLKLKAHVEKRKTQNITLNVNLIGEEVLGEGEAGYRMRKYEEALKSDYINYISIKITTIFSQINILDFEWSKNEIVKRLDKLYGIAVEHSKGTTKKFINLDMEEFKDLELTVASFMESISKFDLKAGIVLQAYIPDSFNYLKKLVEFSKARVESGKPPIKIRLVKGANMESEETIASVRDWPLPTFRSKIDTDSNYNRMLNYVLDNENYKYVDIGIASHNIFQIAYAIERIKEVGAGPSFTFEMLEGMNMKASFLVSKTNPLILYAPVCNDAHFNNAIAYLIRRLDENTNEANFMRHAFSLSVGSKEWLAQEEIFKKSIEGMPTLRTESYRVQNRLTEKLDLNITNLEERLSTFHNEADTDFILKPNQEWALGIKAKYENLKGLEVAPIIGENTPKDTPKDILKKGSTEKIGTVYNANKDSINNAVNFLKESKTTLSFLELGEILLKTAEIIASKRGDFIGLSALEVGKTFIETDAEVSEAIDFLRFYPHSMKKLLDDNKELSFRPKGIGVAITPWNFPVGISVGSVSSALASGNRVIYKPSNTSVSVGQLIVECFYEAGLPKDYLVFLPSSGKDINEYLLGQVDFAILTGGEDTAYEILTKNPTLYLSAETGGKNATIVTKLSDRDQAIKNVVHSAFSNSGQKCSATSLLILEEEVYNDENFKNTLVDAASSLNVGSPFDLKNRIGLLAIAPSDNKNAQTALDTLSQGEGWALKPSYVDNNNYALKPAIRYGTVEGDFCHRNELFAPILSVMSAKDLKHAIKMVNDTGYGLTSGLESLDEREWDYWLEHIEAGNLYINKSTTGAIVLRQPFGGIKKSAIGFGRKVGFYNYVTQFLEASGSLDKQKALDSNISSRLQFLLDAKLKDHAFKSDMQEVLHLAKNYAYFYDQEFASPKEYVHIRGENNIFSYNAVKKVCFRVHNENSLVDIFSVIVACSLTKSKLTLSLSTAGASEQIGLVLECFKYAGLENIEVVHESLEDFASKSKDFDLIRYIIDASAEDVVFKKAAEYGKLVFNKKPLMNGYLELLNYHQEQSASISFHRYGNLGRHALKQ
ncbi:1-pyrroline-5-carboxylate dehydrogenase [Helicobacter sp. 13S00401-1]|uniref:bifunctional proline dehydrogenase/L-glutamate gamma-semialdehyde dehydrogenase n=1 Tax=Helicobacter sp. 13S00401-1 TaxID=1905758 RepID=UPI000BCDC4B3|nr:bifunctional proline dehydrogenase/L-glutamate gamma-semialdehyde dehydrogenase [Helicobacter sp. 13S00401-1]PAF50152.1 1-pyrroline-5-carboxylate dehydrogenase [Helicobacter sp. 13S00401-1]